MFAGHIQDDLVAQGLSLDITLEPVREQVRSADFAALNLESAVCVACVPIDKEHTFNSDASGLAALRSAGFDLVSLANNHVLDYGPDGLGDTLARLDEVGLAHAGITEEDEPQTPVVVRMGAVTIGWLGYADAETPFAYAQEYFAFARRPARADPAIIRRDLAALAPQVDLAVIEVHWGLEDQPITPRQRQLGNLMIDSGAAIVVGHHPHVQQDAEWYRGGLILYSLGNFVFGLPAAAAEFESRLYRVEVDRQGVLGAEFMELEIRTDTWAPTPISGEYLPVAR
jgi:poly-gamma-glutamate synthesis protein (capsule biosynthesis protein)